MVLAARWYIKIIASGKLIVPGQGGTGRFPRGGAELCGWTVTRIWLDFRWWLYSQDAATVIVRNWPVTATGNDTQSWFTAGLVALKNLNGLANYAAWAYGHSIGHDCHTLVMGLKSRERTWRRSHVAYSFWNQSRSNLFSANPVRTYYLGGF